MADLRCPYHDVVFEALTDSRKPGARAIDNEGKPTGELVHPSYQVGSGYVSGHPDCPLCQRAEKQGDPALILVPRTITPGVRTAIR